MTLCLPDIGRESVGRDIQRGLLSSARALGIGLSPIFTRDEFLLGLQNELTSDDETYESLQRCTNSQSRMNTCGTLVSMLTLP